MPEDYVRKTVFNDEWKKLSDRILLAEVFVESQKKISEKTDAKINLMCAEMQKSVLSDSDLKGVVKALTVRIDNTLQKYDEHIEGVKDRNNKIFKLSCAMISQIVAFIFSCAVLSTYVYILVQDNEVFRNHIKVDEGRWNVFRIEEKISE